MKIGLNGQRVLIAHPAGPEKYTINLFKALGRIDHDNDYTIYLPHKPDKEFFKELTSHNPNFSYRIIDRKRLWTQIGLAQELRKTPVDVFFSSVHTIPVMRNKDMKVVGMIHGLEYKYSKNFDHPLKKKFINWPEKYVCEHADEIIVPSKATTVAIQNEGWKPIKNDNIHIVYEGVDESFRKRTSRETARVTNKYGLTEMPYIIAVSTIQPRKNYPRMIEGFSKALLENKSFSDYILAIVGKKGWNYEKTIAAPEKFGVRDNVIFLGRVPDEDLPQLYSGATAFVSTSLEEGFGLPLVEALASEIPTIVSDIPAFREVGSNFPIFVNPKETESIKEGFLNVLSTPPKRKALKEAAAYAKTFSWDTNAEKVLRIMHDTQSLTP